MRSVKRCDELLKQQDVFCQVYGTGDHDRLVWDQGKHLLHGLTEAVLAAGFLASSRRRTRPACNWSLSPPDSLTRTLKTIVPNDLTILSRWRRSKRHSRSFCRTISSWGIIRSQ